MTHLNSMKFTSHGCRGGFKVYLLFIVIVCVCAAIYFWRSEDSCGVGFLVMWILRIEHGSPGSFGKG